MTKLRVINIAEMLVDSFPFGDKSDLVHNTYLRPVTILVLSRDLYWMFVRGMCVPGVTRAAASATWRDLYHLCLAPGKDRYALTPTAMNSANATRIPST